MLGVRRPFGRLVSHRQGPGVSVHYATSPRKQSGENEPPAWGQKDRSSVKPRAPASGVALPSGDASGKRTAALRDWASAPARADETSPGDGHKGSDANAPRPAKHSNRTRISDEAWDALQEGELVEAIVEGVRPFGAFLKVIGGSEVVQAALGVEGLLPRLRMSLAPVEDATQYLQPGEPLWAVVARKEVDEAGTRRVMFSTDELEREPGDMLHDRAATLKAAAETWVLRQAARRAGSGIQEGQLVEGVVFHVDSYGVRVSFAKDDARHVGTGSHGYLSVADISGRYVFSAADHFKNGDTVIALATSGEKRDAVGRLAVALNTRLLEAAPGDVLRDREAVYERARQLAAAAAAGQGGRLALTTAAPAAAPASVPDWVWQQAPVGALVAGVVETVQPSGLEVRVELPSGRLLRQLAEEGRSQCSDSEPDGGSSSGEKQGAVGDTGDAGADGTAVSVCGLLRTRFISRLRLGSPDPVFSPGDVVCAVVDQQQHEAGRLVLGMWQLEDWPGDIIRDPAGVFRAAARRHLLGQAVTPGAPEPPHPLEVGQLVYGLVRGFADSAAFLELAGYGARAVLRARDFTTAANHGAKTADGTDTKASSERQRGGDGDRKAPSSPIPASARGGAAAEQASDAPPLRLQEHLRVGDVVAAVVRRLPGPEEAAEGGGQVAVVSTRLLEYEPGEMLADRQAVFREAPERMRVARWAARYGCLARALWAIMQWPSNTSKEHYRNPTLAVMQTWLGMYAARYGGLGAASPATGPAGIGPAAAADTEDATVRDAASMVDAEGGPSMDVATAQLLCSRGGPRWRQAAAQVLAAGEAREAAWEEEARDAASLCAGSEAYQRFVLQEYREAEAYHKTIDALLGYKPHVWEVVEVAPRAALLKTTVKASKRVEHTVFGCLHAHNLERPPPGEEGPTVAGEPARVDRALKPGDKVSALRCRPIRRIGDTDDRAADASAADMAPSPPACRPLVHLSTLDVAHSSAETVPAMVDRLTESPERALAAGPRLLALASGRVESVVEETKSLVRDTVLPAAGSLCHGTVVNIRRYGVFVELADGVTALLHISQVSGKRVEDLSAVFREGDSVTCLVLKTDEERNRVTLSTKKLELQKGDMLHDPQLVYARAKEALGRRQENEREDVDLHYD